MIPAARRAHKMDYTLHPYTVNVNYETSKENEEKTEWKLYKEMWGGVESVYPCEKVTGSQTIHCDEFQCLHV